MSQENCVTYFEPVPYLLRDKGNTTRLKKFSSMRAFFFVFFSKQKCFHEKLFKELSCSTWQPDNEVSRKHNFVQPTQNLTICKNEQT